MHGTSRNAAAEARGVPKTDQLGSMVNRENSSRSRPAQGQRGGRSSRTKGARIERELVALHLQLGVHAERYPLSGASRFRGSGHDLDIYALGQDEAPLVAECKARKRGQGFAVLERWLGEYDALFLRRNNAEPVVVLPWRVWAQLLEQVRR
jgi:Holliday junction resolvase